MTTATATDADRLTSAYQQHAADLLRYLLRRAHNTDDAADLLAQIYLVTWRRIADLPDGEDARPWLFGLAHHVLNNHRRGQGRHLALAGRLREELRTFPSSPSEPDPRAEALSTALARVPAQDRDLLLLTVWDGLTTQEAAQALGILPATARSRISRVRDRLRAEVPTILDDIRAE